MCRHQPERLFLFLFKILNKLFDSVDFPEPESPVNQIILDIVIFYQLNV